MKWKQLLSLALLISSVAFTALALRPVRAVSLDEAESISGSVRAVRTDSSTGDIAVYLRENDVMYYINRGLYLDFDANQLKTNLVNKPVVIYYAKHWTPLDPLNRHKHIVRVQVSENILYDEISL
mgnify:CR=1 FL=1